VFNLPIEKVIPLHPDGVIKSFRLQTLKNVRLGERRIATKESLQGLILVSFYNRFQNGSPVIGTMNVTMSQQGSFQIAVLVKAKQRVITGPAKVTVINRTFLPTMSWTF